MKILAMLLYVELISIGSKLTHYATGIEGHFGGPVSWVAGVGMLFVFIRMMYLYISESKNAIRVLKIKKLPCTTCGYPMMDGEFSICPECGKKLERQHVIAYWKKRNLMNPLPFESEMDVL